MGRRELGSHDIPPTDIQRHLTCYRAIPNKPAEPIVDGQGEKGKDSKDTPRGDEDDRNNESKKDQARKEDPPDNSGKKVGPVGLNSVYINRTQFNSYQ